MEKLREEGGGRSEEKRKEKLTRAPVESFNATVTEVPGSRGRMISERREGEPTRARRRLTEINKPSDLISVELSERLERSSGRFVPRDDGEVVRSYSILPV